MILQAAQKLGVENRVKGWGCSTPCNTDFLAKALGPKWNHKLFVNAEMTDADDHNGPEMQALQGILAKYGSAVAGGIGSFSQFGFVLGEVRRAGASTRSRSIHDRERQRSVQGLKDVQDRDALSAVVLRGLPLQSPTTPTSL